MEHHGTEFATRHKLSRERVESMKGSGREDTAEYHGEVVDFAPMQTWPKPVQKPHVPVIVGVPIRTVRAARHDTATARSRRR